MTTPVLKRLTDQEERDNPGTGDVTMWFHCPGCGHGHGYRVQRNKRLDGKWPVWDWNGDMVKPTFTPSLLVDQHRPESRCHLFVTDGMIRFLNDCHHELKGQTVPMVSVEDDD